MGRIRTVKPELGRHADLYDLEIATGLPLRFAWVMLFTACDREGRFRWRPRELKPECLPHDALDFADVLAAFHRAGLVRRYVIDGDDFGYIPTWKKHQWVNKREQASTIPAPTLDGEALGAALIKDSACTSQSQCVTSGERKVEVEGKEERSRARETSSRPPIVEPTSLVVSHGQSRANSIGLIAAWNNVAAAHPPLAAIDGDPSPNRTAMALRMRPDINWWADVFKRVSQSDYCMGRKSHPPFTFWKALDKAEKVATGDYDNWPEKPAPSKPKAESPYAHFPTAREIAARNAAALAAGGGKATPEEVAAIIASRPRRTVQ